MAALGLKPRGQIRQPLRGGVNILVEIDWPKWLGEEPAGEQELLALLRPCQDEVLQIWPVDKMVGNVKNNGLS